MQAWPEWRDGGGLKSVSTGNRLFESYWRDAFDRVFHGGIDTWDYQWLFACWYHGMLGALPAHNQIYNLGFGPGATHTTAGTPICVRESISQPLAFPLQHPSRVERTPSVDMLTDRYVLGLTCAARIRRLVGEIPLLGEFLKRLRRGFIGAK